MNDDESKIDRLERLGKQLLSKKKKAVNARLKSGIETVWNEDADYYQGIDDANRHENKSAITKDMADRGGFSPKSKSKRGGSTIFMNISKQYTDIASMSLADMLLPIDDANFELRPTPKPTTMELMQAKPVSVGVVMYKNQQMPVEAFENIILQEAKKKAEKAQVQIEDWLTECGWHREVRHVLKDAAKLGVGIMKGCYPVTEKKKSMHQLNNNMQGLALSTEIKPASKRIDPHNFFPDPSCRENIHNGSYVWERDYITAKQLRELRGSGYLDSQIELVLKESKDIFSSSKAKNVDSFEIWYYYGEMNEDDLKACDCEIEEKKQCDCESKGIENCDCPSTTGNMHSVIVAMVNDHVIKATINPLESGEFPYDVMVWQPMADTWTGIGIARQVREPQRIINAATRNLLDNAGRGGRPTMIIADGVESADGGVIEVGSGGLLRLAPDSAIQDARQAISSVIIPIITQDLMAIIQYALKMAEDITGLPMLLQGQQGNAPDTVGGMTMLQNNAGTIRRNVARNFDDMVTVPHMRRYYEWLMLFGEDEGCKGDFNIEARGSSVLFERDAQHQSILNMGAMVANPAFQINPAKWIDEAFKAQRLDPTRFKFTPEELQAQQAQAQQQPPPQDPAVQIAQMRIQADTATAAAKVQADMQIAQAKAAADMDKAKFQQSTDIAELQVKEQLAADAVKHKAEESRLQREHDMQMMQLQRELKIMELSQSSQISIAQIKAQLAQTAQKLNVQTQLSVQTPVMTPPTEPSMQAEKGKAFQE